MYGFYIHGCIDGGSNFAPYAIVALDKSASTLFNAYHEATTAFEHPLRLRADMCFEAVRIGQDMIDVRGPGAYLTGPSTANQRIERFWNNVWSHVASYFKGLFQYMERCGVLNRYNPSHLYSLVTVFLTILQARLKLFCQAWNCHPVRPLRSRGIQTYYPNKRFMKAVLDFRSLTRDDLRRIQVISPQNAVELIEGSNRGNVASDHVERAGHAAVLQSPLNAEEQAHCNSIFRTLPGDWAEDKTVERYLVHCQVTTQIVLARPYLGASISEQSHFVSNARGGSDDLCGHICAAYLDAVASLV